MKLLPQHVALLTPLERKVYAPFIGEQNAKDLRKQYFLSQSYNYIEGDEDKLPFPERSKRGVMLFTLSQQLALSPNLGAVFLKPKIPEYANFIKSKLLALGAPKVYSVPPEQIKAAIHGKGKSPFWYYRNNEQFPLKGIDEEIARGAQGYNKQKESPQTESHQAGNTQNENVHIEIIQTENKQTENKQTENAQKENVKKENAQTENNIICAINPPPGLMGNTGEYEVLSMLLKTSNGIEELESMPLFTTAATLGLLQVDDIKHGRFWLTREP